MKLKFLPLSLNIFILFMFIQITAFSQPAPTYAEAQEYDLNEFGPSNPSHFADLNGTLFFSVGPIIEDEYLKSTSDSRMDVVVGLYKMVDSEPVKIIDDWDWISINNVTAIGDYVYFAINKEDGSELWKSDGTNTELVKAFIIMYDDEAPNLFKHEEAVFTEINFITEFNGSIFFSADDGENGDELWISDGTAAGTSLFKEINEGYEGAGITALTVFGNHFYFPANDGFHGSELWISDGTPEGTVLHEDIYQNINKAASGEDYDEGSTIEDMVTMGEYIYFTANDGYGISLWRTNESETSKVTEVITNVSRLESFDDNVLYFSAAFSDYDSPESGISVDPEFPPTPPGAELKLWKYTIADGFVQIDDDFLYVSTDPKKMIKSGDLVYFAQNNKVVGRELWATDGETAWLVKNIYNPIDYVEAEDDPNYLPPASAAPSPRNFIDINGKLFFTADEGDGSEYWRTEGTEASTVRVTNINPVFGEDVNTPEEEYYGVYDNVFYFPATNTTELDKELWSINILHFTTQPVSDTKYVDDSGFSLSAAAVGNGEVTYQWQKDGEDLAEETSSTLTFPNPLVQGDAGTYTCIVSDNFYGSLASEEAVLEVYHNIIITEQPNVFTSICEWNTGITLSIDASSTGEFDYQWYKNGEIIYGANESTLSILNNPFNSGTYTCLLSNEDIQVWTEEAVVVMAATTDITKHPTSQENSEEGSDVTFLVIAEGENLQYQWRKNGVKLSNSGNISGVSLPVLSVNGITADDEGAYDCAIIGECLVLVSQSASLTVLDTEAEGTSTSLDELAKQGISVFPNPSDGRFSIQLKEVTNEVVINIYDLTGKAVYTNAANADYFEIDISDKQKGIYILRIELGNRIINSKIILK